ncbi:MAG: hypothetical protein JW787_02750 [Sedimentisphaerales bacterium]|nr:hypothetical protein [Sedimentisphaerales bacterium]
MAKFLSSLNKVVVVRLILLAFGFLGTFIIALPDIYPNSNLISLPPYIASLDAGFADLNRFDEVEQGTGTSISILRRADRGYEAIYDLVQIFNPNISSTGAIRADEEIKWRTAYGKIPIFRPVLFLDYSGQEVKPIPICNLGDLAFLIRDYKIRFWSGVGVTVVLIVLISQLALEIILAVSTEPIGALHLRAEEPIKQLAALNISEGRERVKSSSGKEGIAGILFLVFLFFLLLVQIKKGGSKS